MICRKYVSLVLSLAMMGGHQYAATTVSDDTTQDAVLVAPVVEDQASSTDISIDLSRWYTTEDDKQESAELAVVGEVSDEENEVADEVEEPKTGEVKKPLAPVFTDLIQYMNKKYVGITGFGIPQAESDCIIAAKGAPTYGEIKPESLAELAEYINFTQDDVFYDFGSGVGKVTIQIFLTTPAKKSVGIELSDTRYNNAQKVRKEIMRDVKNGDLFDFQERLDEEFWACKNPEKRVNFKKKKLAFQHKNFMKAKYKDATVIFMCSTCFSDELMQELTDLFAQLTDGLRVITLKRLPEHSQFTLLKTLTLPMTWSETTPVHVYQLSNPDKPKKAAKKSTKSCCSSACKTTSCK